MQGLGYEARLDSNFEYVKSQWLLLKMHDLLHSGILGMYFSCRAMDA